jgi:hypothetical protein
MKNPIQQWKDEVNKNISSNVKKLTSLKNIDPTIVLTLANILHNIKTDDYKQSEIKIPNHLIIDFLTVYLTNKKNLRQGGEESGFLEISQKLVQFLITKKVLDNEGLLQENIINLLLFPQSVYPFHLLEILNTLYKSFDNFYQQNYKFTTQDYIEIVKQGVSDIENHLSNDLPKSIKESLIDLDWFKIDKKVYNKNLLESLSVKKNFEIENIDWDTFLSKCVLESKPLFKYENDFYLMNISRLYCDGIKFFYNKILEVGTKESENIRQDLSKNKFEDLVAKTFQEILPNATIYKSCTYKNGECDFLVIFSGTLLIIECKNGFVTDGLKNDGKREWYDDKKDKFQQQIVKPYEQAQRTKDYIFSDKFSGFTVDGKRINLDKNKIDKTFLISVTADYWGNLAAYPDKLKEYGVINFGSRLENNNQNPSKF